MKKLIVIFTLSLLSSFALAAGPAASIEQLDWMTGNWAGNLGPNQLEENWIASEGNSLMAAVRMTGYEATSKLEMITIEEAEGCLVLHIQQWDPGFVPRTESAMEMELTEITGNSVSFVNVSGFGMPTLGYSHPDSETFIIHVGQEGGGSFDIELKALNIWN